MMKISCIQDMWGYSNMWCGVESVWKRFTIGFVETTIALKPCFFLLPLDALDTLFYEYTYVLMYYKSEGTLEN